MSAIVAPDPGGIFHSAVSAGLRADRSLATKGLRRTRIVEDGGDQRTRARLPGYTAGHGRGWAARLFTELSTALKRCRDCVFAWSVPGVRL